VHYRDGQAGTSVQICEGDVIENTRYQRVPYLAALAVFALVLVVARIAVGQRIEAPLVFPGMMALAAFGFAKLALWAWRENYPSRQKPTTAARIGDELVVESHQRSWSLPVRELELVRLPVRHILGSIKHGTQSRFQEGVGIYHPKLGVIGCRQRFALSQTPTGYQEQLTFEVSEDVLCTLLRSLMTVEATVLPPENSRELLQP
jgi:hypothetical protein